MIGYTLTMKSETRIEGREIVVCSTIFAAHFCRRILLIGRRCILPALAPWHFTRTRRTPQPRVCHFAKCPIELWSGNSSILFAQQLITVSKTRVKAEKADTPVLCKKTWATSGANGLAHTSEGASLEWGSKLSACLTWVCCLPFCKALVKFILNSSR